MLALACTAQWLHSPAPAHPDRLQQVRERGSLVVLMRNGPSGIYEDALGLTGPEYQLARGFADFLGVELEVRMAESYLEMADLLEDGAADLAAANITRTPRREVRFRFGPDYAQSQTVIVTRRGLRAPRSLADLAGLRVAVLADSPYEDQLQAASESAPGLAWTPFDGSPEELLLALDQGELDATLLDERSLTANLSFYPNAVPALGLKDARPKAWAFQRDNDDSLVQQAEIFLRLAEDDGTLAALEGKFFGPPRRAADRSLDQFVRHVRERLPAFLPVFREVAEANELDWRLLAAVGFQESRWDPEASSPTGVRGLMMLTRDTAGELGLDDRLDPLQSIDGGARYLRQLMEQIPEGVPHPDRGWMALAAYNIGLGHLEDARVLTERQGGNPDSWNDVSARLPLLAQKAWHSTTRHGYARGHEAQQHVELVRRYYDALIHMDTHDHPLLASRISSAP